MSQSRVEPFTSAGFAGRALFVVNESGLVQGADEVALQVFGERSTPFPLCEWVAAPGTCPSFQNAILQALQLLSQGDARVQMLDFRARKSDETEFAATLEMTRAPQNGEQDTHFEARVQAATPFPIPEQVASPLLHPAQTQWQTLLGAVRDGVLVHDTEGKISYANQTAATQLGFGSVSALIAVSAAQLWEQFHITHEAGETVDLVALTQNLPDGKTAECSLVFRAPGGEEKCFLATICALEEGATLWVLHEVSARRRPDVELLLALQKQERAAAETTAILTQIADAVIITDATGQITFLNDAARALPGLNGQAKNETELYLGTFLTPEAEPLSLSEAPIARVLREKTNLVGGQWIVRQYNGHETTLQGSAAPLFAQNGELLGAVLILRDISEQRRLLADLQKANSLKDDFLSILSHELRTPLTPLIGWISLLRNMLSSNRELQPQLLTKILVGLETSVEQQQHIVEELLNATTLLIGRVHFQKMPYPLSTLIEETLENLRHKGKLEGFKVQCHFAPDLPPLPLDLARFSQALHHILDNALAFSPPGGTIWISTRHVDDCVILSVRDEGRGINPDFLPYIFEPFRQNEETSTRSHGGLGLGLTLVRAIVEGHGGHIIAISKGSGQGTRIVITLPI